MPPRWQAKALSPENQAVLIRPAAGTDLSSLTALAERDSAPAPQGAVLLAVVDGDLWAALGLHDGRLVADPFRPSAPAAELLRVRARQLNRPAHGPPAHRARGRRWRLPRPASWRVAPTNSP